MSFPRLTKPVRLQVLFGSEKGWMIGMHRIQTTYKLTFKANVPLKIVLIYIVIGGLWIVFSDQLLAVLIDDIPTLARLSTLKGWFYTVITAVMLYGLIRRDITALQLSQKELMESIDERKQAEAMLKVLNEQLEQRVKERTIQLEAINDELEAFSFSVSHDLRAPLRQITSFVNLIHSSDILSPNKREEHYLENITSIVGRMDNLITNLLAFSKAGRAEMQYQTVDLLALVNEVRQELEDEVSVKLIEWEVGALPCVKGDPKLLSLVFENLLSNALKYTRPRDKPHIQIGSSQSNNSEVVIFVSDNGVGFDMNYASKLFGVFQRLHPVSEFEGNGIGLANVRRIIHRHGGRTWAKGEVDKGATFYFSLPQPLN
jgi:light-regulated signal transduction histidine kinase (bacteriophytochrome)